jgi:hypothetical protein
MIPLKRILPKPTEWYPDPVAPLGIAFGKENCNINTRELDLDSEVIRMKTYLHTHPLIGAVSNAQPSVSGPPTGSNPQLSNNATPVVTSVAPQAQPRGRRSSIGGDRAQAIAAQFEVSEPDEEESSAPAQMEEYPESLMDSGDYIDDVSISEIVQLEAAPSSRPTTPRRRRI